jgi:hypothetical protein
VQLHGPDGLGMIVFHGRNASGNAPTGGKRPKANGNTFNIS